MHYYTFNIDKFRGAVGHLNNDQELAYRRLMDHYYDKEEPIPNDIEFLARRMRTTEEVIQYVLIDFFELIDGAWNHKVIDEALAAYREKAEKNRENGAKGGRPPRKKEAQGKAEEKPSRLPSGSQSEPSGNPSESGRNPNKELITINQSIPPISPASGGDAVVDGTPVTTAAVSKGSDGAKPPARARRDAAQKLADAVPSEAFDRFWAAWPPDRRSDKAKCILLWNKMGWDTVIDSILADIEVRRAGDRWKNGFIELTTTYLNNMRWNDGVTASSGHKRNYNRGSNDNAF